MFSLAISCLTTSNLPWFPFTLIPLLFLTASDFTPIISHICSWVLFSLWPHLFILSGVISPLLSSSKLDTYQPGEFIFQYPIFLPFHTVHGVLKARILTWFAIPFSSGHVLSDPSDPSLWVTMTHLSWVALHGIASSFTELDKALFYVISLISFLWLWFSVCLPSDGEKDKRLVEAFWRERLTGWGSWWDPTFSCQLLFSRKL